MPIAKFPYVGVDPTFCPHIPTQGANTRFIPTPTHTQVGNDLGVLQTLVFGDYRIYRCYPGHISHILSTYCTTIKAAVSPKERDFPPVKTALFISRCCQFGSFNNFCHALPSLRLTENNSLQNDIFGSGISFFNENCANVRIYLRDV